MNTTHVNAADWCWPDSLRNGIWPRSLALWMTAIWLALFVIKPWDQLIPELGAIRFERIYAWTTIGLVLLQGKFRFCGSRQTTGVLLFMLALAVSWLFAFEPSAGSDELYTYATLVAFYFILLSAIRTPYQLVFIALCYVVAMAAYLGKAQYEYFFNGAGRYTMGVLRLIGIETTYGGPNAVGASTVLTLPFWYFFWQYRRRFTETWPAIYRQWFPRCLVLYFLLAISSIVLTNSRASMLGFVAFVLLAALGRRGKQSKAVAFGGVVILLAAVWIAMPQESKNRLRTVWDPSAGPSSAQASATGRIAGMKVGLEMFQQSPITGAGIGNFIPYRLAHIDDTPAEAHSLIGQMLGETGLVGAGAFLALLAALFANCRTTERLAEQTATPGLRMLADLAIACRSGVILLLFLGLSGHNLFRFNWLWLAAFALLCCKFAEDLCDDDQHAGYSSGSARPEIGIGS